jgi:hypothetical protein
MNKFTAKQKEIVARKLGYDGPMQGFDDFIKSSPALGMKYATIGDKFATRMAKGGVVKKAPVKKYQAGGDVTGGVSREEAERLVRERFATIGRTGIGEAASNIDQAGFEGWVNSLTSGNVKPQDLNTTFKTSVEDYIAQKPDDMYSKYVTDFMTKSTGGVTYDAEGKPKAGEAAQAGVAQIVSTPEQNIDTTARAGAAETATAGQAAATTAAAPTTVGTSTYDATQAAANIGELMAGVSPAIGSITEESMVQAQQMDPRDTLLADMQAAQGVTRTVQGAPTRTEQAGEMVSGSAVDQARTDALAAQTAASAAQGVVTEEMTVQGQLNKLMADFDAGNPPPWAAANLRAVTATLAARGLGASSMAGQALIQATLESALPIASADAQAYQSVAAQNLSNRQQTAVLAAQQRAAFMGQEFDQAFQTRVVNAAKVSDIANMNFTAQQQVALENARLAQTMDLANLSNNQAMVMANAAQIATLETTNLNNRQQAAVVNAQQFLQMDMVNLSNMQQTTLFRAQQMSQAMLSDTAADNAAKQFNSTSTNQTNQFNTQLSTQVSQFNASQQNAIAQFNTDQANAISKFNAEVKNQRETFNAQQRLVIDQANAQWQREIATANTAATNAANIINAQLSQQMSMTEYNNETQMYRDDVAHAWQSAENDASRATQLAAAEISAAASISSANIKADAEASSAVGNFVARVLLT